MHDFAIDYVSTTLWIVISGICVLPLMCLRNVRQLTSVAAAGLISLFSSVICLFVFGMFSYDASNTVLPIPLIPEDYAHLSTFLGVCAYCFGYTVFIFPIQESMQNKHEIMKALLLATMAVYVFYMFTGPVLAYLYYYSGENPIHSNILENLPSNNMITVILKLILSMVLFIYIVCGKDDHCALLV